MSGENKIIWGTVGLAIVGMVIVFGLLIALSPKELSPEERQKVLVREDSYTFADIAVVGNDALENKIQMVAFEDFQCPACGLVQEDFKRVKEEYKDRIEFIFRHFPLRTIHPNAQKSSEAAEAAGAQGKFYEIHDILFAKQTEWGSLSGDELFIKFSEYASEAGVPDIERFDQELRDGLYADKVSRDLADGELLGVKGTPTVFINGEKVLNPTYEGIKTRIDSL